MKNRLHFLHTKVYPKRPHTSPQLAMETPLLEKRMSKNRRHWHHYHLLWITIWLWLTVRHGKIQGHLYHGYVSHNQRVCEMGALGWLGCNDPLLRIGPFTAGPLDTQAPGEPSVCSVLHRFLCGVRQHDHHVRHTVGGTNKGHQVLGRKQHGGARRVLEGFMVSR